MVGDLATGFPLCVHEVKIMSPKRIDPSAVCGVVVFLVLAMFCTVPLNADETREKLRESDVASFLGNSRQMLVVLAPDWDNVHGMLQRYERQNDTAPWRAVGEPVAVSLGRSGQGWGRGLHPPDTALADEPEKREGDGRAPTGVFALTGGFAYNPEELAGAALPIARADQNLVCVDDPASRSYNVVTSGNVPDKDWESCENMLRTDHRYQYGIMVAHNQNPAQPGAGSCIFLHVEFSPGYETSGCTAMSPEAIKAVILWLDPDAVPLLVQLPEPVSARVKQDWGLP